MSFLPLLQVALDFIELSPALAIAYLAAPEVDIIEVGTPLCKAEGMNAVRAIRKLCPDKIILADMKAPDTGGVEAKLAFEAGADWMTVIGGAPLATVQAALDEARRQGKEILMELTGVRDILARAGEWRSLGVERMVYHLGWDEEHAARRWNEQDLETIRQLIERGFKVTVTGGLKAETLPFFQGLPISVFIAGRAIHAAEDPRAAARHIRETIARLWSDKEATSKVAS